LKHGLALQFHPYSFCLLLTGASRVGTKQRQFFPDFPVGEPAANADDDSAKLGLSAQNAAALLATLKRRTARAGGRGLLIVP
jgi:hypothetical protein